MNVGKLNEALCVALGVDWKTQHVTGVTLQLRPDRVPTLTVDLLLIDEDQVQRVVEVAKHFELREVNV